MKTILFASALLTLLVMSQPAPAMNYAWLTNWEATADGSIIRFTGRDTIWGPVHSNDWIATQNFGGLPVFYGAVSTSRPGFRPGSPNPAGQFMGGPPRFNAPEVGFPESLNYVQGEAANQGRVFSYRRDEHYVSIHDNSLHLYTYPEGTLLDTTRSIYHMYPLNAVNYFYFESKIDIRGVIPSDGCELIIGCSESIRVVDNVMLEGTHQNNGTIPYGATSAICLASEQDIVIGNTWENGRENSALGSGVVITALIFALRGSFQMEQMNDVDDPYVCSCSPDERGTLIVNGGITQWQRGYTHRSNRNGTGYSRRLLYDERLRYWNTGVFESPFAQDVPDSLVFADTPVGTTSLDTLHIDRLGPFSGALATQPFFTNAPYQYQGPFNIPVSFEPSSVGPHYGNLTFFLAGEFQNVILYGNGISAGPQIVEAEIFPNPFNSQSTIRFELSESANVRAIVYDVLGRQVANIADETFAPGSHQLTLNADNWSSGLYFLRFETLGQIETRKLMLIK